jgi:hypothetical protein
VLARLVADGDVQFVEEGADAAFDVIADGADGGEVNPNRSK